MGGNTSEAQMGHTASKWWGWDARDPVNSVDDTPPHAGIMKTSSSVGDGVIAMTSSSPPQWHTPSLHHCHLPPLPGMPPTLHLHHLSTRLLSRGTLILGAPCNAPAHPAPLSCPAVQSVPAQSRGHPRHTSGPQSHIGLSANAPPFTGHVTSPKSLSLSVLPASPLPNGDIKSTLVQNARYRVG